jgi:hypothetical protein
VSLVYFIFHHETRLTRCVRRQRFVSLHFGSRKGELCRRPECSKARRRRTPRHPPHQLVRGHIIPYVLPRSKWQKLIAFRSSFSQDTPPPHLLSPSSTARAVVSHQLHHQGAAGYSGTIIGRVTIPCDPSSETRSTYATSIKLNREYTQYAEELLDSEGKSKLTDTSKSHSLKGKKDKKDEKSHLVSHAYESLEKFRPGVLAQKAEEWWEILKESVTSSTRAWESIGSTITPRMALTSFNDPAVNTSHDRRSRCQCWIVDGDVLGSSGVSFSTTIDASSNHLCGQQSCIADATPSHSWSKYPSGNLPTPRSRLLQSKNILQFTIQVGWFNDRSGSNEFVGQDVETPDTEEDWYELPDASEDAEHAQ